MQSSTTRTDQIPRLLNESFSVAFYDGGVFLSEEVAGNFDIENVLVPTRDVFHCSDNGTKKNLILKCSSDFTLTHIFIQAPKRRCSDPIRSCLAWVSDSMPNVEHSRYFDDIPIEVIKTKFADTEPIVISTNRESLDGETELFPWRSGRYVHLKFFDTHSSTQNNIDIAVVGLVGFSGRVSKTPQPELGSWLKRQLSPPRTVHPHVLSATFSSRGWCCDGRDFSGGCRGGFNDFNETSVYDLSFRCTSCGFDLCEFCASDPSVGRVSNVSAANDLSRLRNDRTGNMQSKRLAFTRIRNSLRIDPAAFGEYLAAGILTTLGRFKYGSARESALLLTQVLARLNPRPISSPTDLLYLVCESSGDIRTVSLSPTQLAGSSEVACIDLSDGSSHTYPKSHLVPVSNKLSQVEATAKLFAISRGDLDVSLAKDLVDKADPSIPNGLGELLPENLLSTHQEGEFELELLIESSNMERSSQSPPGLFRKDWLKELRRVVVDRLVSQLSQAESIDGELVRSLILIQPEFTEEVKLLTLRLLNSGFATDVANAVRLIAGVIESDRDGLVRFGASAWADKAARHLTSINSSIDISEDLQRIKDSMASESVEVVGRRILHSLAGELEDLSSESQVVSELKSKDSLSSDFISTVCEYLLLREDLPVHRLVTESSGRSGFAQLTAPITVGISKSFQVQMEPLVGLGQLRRMVCLTQPIVDLNYLRFCYELVGCVIDLHNGSGRGLVVGFELVFDIGFHEVRFGTGSKKLNLSVRNFDIINRESPVIDNIDLRTRLSFERLADPSIVGELEEFRPLLSQRGELIVVENPRSGLHTILPLIGLTHSPRGWLVPESLDPNNLAVLDSIFSSRTSSSAGGQNAPSSISIEEDCIFSVAIQVDASEVPFELIWPMIREEVYDAIRPYAARSWAGGMSRIEQSVMSGVHSARGLGTIVRGLTREEAQSVRTRVSGVIQTVVIEDREGAVQAETDRQRRDGGSTPQLSIGQRVKWNSTDFGIILNVSNSTCDLIDEATGCLMQNISSQSFGGNRESVRESLRRRLGERIVPALIQLRQPGEDPLLQAFAFGEHEDMDELEEEEEEDDESHDIEQGAPSEEPASPPRVVMRRLDEHANLGSFFLSIGDFLSGIGLRDSSGGSSDSVNVISREIPGLVRGPDLNAPIGERYSADDLLTGGDTNQTPAAQKVDRVCVEVRIDSQSEWVHISSDVASVPLLALFGDRKYSVPKSIEIEFRFISNPGVVVEAISGSAGGSSGPRKRARMVSSEDDSDDMMVSSPRFALGERISQFASVLGLLEKFDRQKLAENPLFILLKECLSRRLTSQTDQVVLLVGEALIRDADCDDQFSLLPDWIRVIPQSFPNLFPETLRLRLVQLTSFPAAITVNWVQQQRLGELLSKRSQLQSDLNTESVNSDNPRRMQLLSQELSNVEERIARNSFWLGCVKSCLAKLRKNDDFVRMSDSLLKRIAKSPSLLEIQFEGESGFGSAVTRSFFSEVGKYFLRSGEACLWVSSSHPDEYISIGHRGLRLRPRKSQSVIPDCLMLGRLIGRAMAEGFIIPLPISIETWAMIRDPSQDRPVSALPMPGDGTDGEFVGACARGDSMASLAEMGAVFVETGFSGPELVDNGSQISVTNDNVSEFVRMATRWYLHDGIDFQLAAIRQGIDEVFSVDRLLTLTPGELKTTICGEDEISWSEASLREILHFHEGIGSELQEWLIETLMELSNPQKSAFLDFVTSCPRMPPGGSLRIDVFSETLASSNLTSPVVRPAMPPVVLPSTPPFELGSPDSRSSGSSSPLHRMSSDDGLADVVGYPRSRACVCHLYLPRYRSKQTLKERLIEAMVSSVHHDEITA